jgi:hypothetical protein
MLARIAHGLVIDHPFNVSRPYGESNWHIGEFLWLWQ